MGGEISEYGSVVCHHQGETVANQCINPEGSVRERKVTLVTLVVLERPY